MNLLSTFPTLLSFGLIAPLILRVFIGVLIIWLGWERYQKPLPWLSVLYLIFGVFLLIGLYTQIASILSIILISVDYFIDKGGKTFSIEKRWLFVMAKVILLSLLVTGPGFFAFDLPL